MTNQSDQDLRDLVGIDGSPVTCMVGDQIFLMGPLQPADYMACSEWRAGQKIALILGSAASNPFLDVSSIKAEACAKVLSQP